MTQALTVLVLPGWRGSGPDHWQTRWQIAHGYRRVGMRKGYYPAGQGRREDAVVMSLRL